MKTQLIAVPHSVLPDQWIIELWYNGVFVGQVTGADGPGIRVVSKHPKLISQPVASIVEVGLELGRLCPACEAGKHELCSKCECRICSP